MKNGKKLLAVSLAVMMLIAFVVTGCGGEKPAGDGSNTSTDTTSAPKSNVTLCIVMAKGWEKPAMHDLFQKYTDKTGVQFDVQVLPDDKASEIIKTKFATNEFPDIMVNSASVLELNYMMPEQKLVDLTNEPWVDKLINKEDFMADGKVWGLPLWGQDLWGFAVNTEVFQKYNIPIPTSKDELLKAFDILKQNNVQPLYLGSKDPWMVGQMTSGSLWAAIQKDPGLPKKLEANQAKYSEIPGFVSCLADLKSFNDKGYLGPNTMANTWDGQFAAFAEGKAGVGVGLTSWVNEIEKKYPGTADKIEFIPFYIGDNTTIFAGTSGQWYIPKTGKNVDIVKDFFNFAAEQENLNAYYSNLQSISPFKDVKAQIPAAAQKLSDKINSGEYLTHRSHNSLVKGQDYDGLCKLGQEVIIGGKTPEAAAKEYDTMRAKIAKSIGLEGF